MNFAEIRDDWKERNRGTYYSGFISREEKGDPGFAGDRRDVAGDGSGVGASPRNIRRIARRNRKTTALGSLGASFPLNENRVDVTNTVTYL
ncbi:hypothetical protein E2542_SST08124 [Spatholobus suberectus]|nr:hypothetical protein E2542_SST08124 [Spatholobus suberectus]